MEFFTTSTGNLLKYAAAAGVRHCVALSLAGTERLSASPYLRAKYAQETLIKNAGIPYSIVMPAGDARLGEIRFQEWLSQHVHTG